MKRAATLHLTVGVIASFILVALPVQAADPVANTDGARGLSRAALGRVVSGTVDATGFIIDSSGKVVARVGNEASSDAPVVGMLTDVLGMSLDNRRAEIDRLSSSSVRGNKLTAAQGAELRAELDRLAQAETDARSSDDAMTFDEGVAIARDLDALNSRLATMIGIAPFAPLLVGDAADKSQRLVVTTVSRAGTPLSSLGDIVAGTVDSTGVIIDWSGKTVGKILAATAGAGASGVDTTVGTTAFGVQSVADMLGARRAELDRLIYQGETAKKLTSEQAAAFRLETFITSNTETEMRGTEGAISFDEAVILARSLDELNVSIGRALGVTVLPLAVKDASGNNRLAVNTYRMSNAGGGTSPPAAAATTPAPTGSDASAPAANAVPASAPGETPGTTTGTTPGTTPAGTPKKKEVDDAIMDADDFAGTPADAAGAPTAAIASVPSTAGAVPIGFTSTLNIDYTPDNVPTTWWALLGSRRMQLEQAITHALARGTINSRQANVLRKDLAAVTKSILLTRSDPTPITMDQAAAIAGDLDRLSARVATAAKIAPFPALVADSEARLRMVLDNFGDIVKVSTLRPMAFTITLDSRRAEIEAGIVSAIAAGKMTLTQATEFRSWLNRIASDQRAAAVEGVVTQAKAVPLALEMDLLASRLNGLIAPPLSPLVVGTRLMLTSNHVVMLDETNVRRADVEARLNNQLLAGRLSAEQAAKVRAELDAVAPAGAKSQAGETPDTAEMIKFFAAFDGVYETLNRPVAGAPKD